MPVERTSSRIFEIKTKIYSTFFGLDWKLIFLFPVCRNFFIYNPLNSPRIIKAITIWEWLDDDSPNQCLSRLFYCPIKMRHKLLLSIWGKIRSRVDLTKLRSMYLSQFFMYPPPVDNRVTTHRFMEACYTFTKLLSHYFHSFTGRKNFMNIDTAWNHRFFDIFYSSPNVKVIISRYRPFVPRKTQQYYQRTFHLNSMLNFRKCIWEKLMKFISKSLSSWRNLFLSWAVNLKGWSTSVKIL